jgi:hypothetical protein
VPAAPSVDGVKNLISDSSERTPVSTRRAFASGVALLTAGLLLAACSSSGGSATASGGTTSPAAGSTTVSTPAASTSAASTSAAASSVNLGSGGGSFCDLARSEKAAESTEAGAFATDKPAQLEKLEEADLAKLPIYLAHAPSSIKPALTVVVKATEKIFDELKAVNFDYTKLGAADLSSFESPAFDAANKKITAYLSTVCKIPSTVPSG